MKPEHSTRARNPFRELMVTELIDNPTLYRRMFSEQILVGETVTVFRPLNTVLLGPQGSGKSMILNLLRYKVLSEYISGEELQSDLDFVKPFLGISINLQRAYFQAFGRRSAASPPGSDPDIDVSCAADYLNHFLFGEFLKALRFVLSSPGDGLSRWMKLSRSRTQEQTLCSAMSTWRCWYGFYIGANTIDDLMQRCDDRIDTWRRFLNAAIDKVPERIWATKTMVGEPLHYMGNLIQELPHKGNQVPLYVVIDQYEVLPELNPTHGTALQRVVNTLIKARDPVVFFKLGARTHDWGRELRVWGAESRIELQRDYVVIDLSDALMRNENTSRSTFREFAADVALKRMREEGGYQITKRDIPLMFGSEKPDQEASSYFGNDNAGTGVVVGKLPKEVMREVESMLVPGTSPLEARLASAWVYQRLQRGEVPARIGRDMKSRPWRKWSWRKERVLAALFQIASMANSKKHYSGWHTLVELSGANIAAFLLLASEVWDMATKFGHEPIDADGSPTTVPREIQTDGIRIASTKWLQRDRWERTGGSRRYSILSRLGPSIHDAVVEDLALSNPGHTGFSLREVDIDKDNAVCEFLRNGVSWAILEERAHTSKNAGDTTRRKFYLHPLLSPAFDIPHKRVKEPLYITLRQAIDWFTTDEPIVFGTAGRARRRLAHRNQSELPFDEGPESK